MGLFFQKVLVFTMQTPDNCENGPILRKISKMGTFSAKMTFNNGSKFLGSTSIAPSRNIYIESNVVLKCTFRHWNDMILGLLISLLDMPKIDPKWNV